MLSKVFFKSPVAHRCLHDIHDARPENSLAALRAAIFRGYAVEIDLQLSKDDVAMVFHDKILDRLTSESGLIRNYTAQDLGKIALLHGTEGIPTLEEFLNVLKGQVPLIIELKDQDGAMGPNVATLEDATCTLLKTYHGDVAVMSFNPHSVAKCASFAPDIPRGLVTDPFLKNDWPYVPQKRRTELAAVTDYDTVGASFISHNVHDLESPIVASLKQKGAHILCWTVRSVEQEKMARRIADNVTFEGYLA